MMADEPADPASKRRRAGERFQQFAGNGRSFQFLVLTRGTAIFFFCRVDSNIVEYGCGYQDFLRICREMFQLPDEVCIGIDFEEMLDAAGIAVIVGNGCFYQFGNVHMYATFHIGMYLSLLYTIYRPGDTKEIIRMI